MSGRPSRESVMTTLFNTIVSSMQQQFTANINDGDSVLYNPSNVAGLFVGIPVSGKGIPENTTITSLTPLTMSEPAIANGSDVACTTGFLTFGRRFIPWNLVTAQPALFTREPDEELEYQSITLQVQTMKVEVWLYSKAGSDPNVAPIIAVNNLLDFIQNNVFAPDDPATGRFTLGGLVHWCRLQGRVMKEPGDLDGQAIAMAEVLITVP